VAINRRRVRREKEWKGLGKSEGKWRGRLRTESRQHPPLYILFRGSRARDGTWAPSRSVKLRHHRRHGCDLAVRHGVDGESEVSNASRCSRTRKSTRGLGRVTEAVVRSGSLPLDGLRVAGLSCTESKHQDLHRAEPACARKVKSVDTQLQVPDPAPYELQQKPTGRRLRQ
jgi:hypothetical protein